MVEDKTNNSTFALPAQCDISTVMWCHENLNNYIENNDSMMLSAAGVEKITSPAIQLLIALDKKMSAKNEQLIVADHSDVFAEAFRDLGLMVLLQKWSKEV